VPNVEGSDEDARVGFWVVLVLVAVFWVLSALFLAADKTKD